MAECLHTCNNPNSSTTNQPGIYIVDQNITFKATDKVESHPYTYFTTRLSLPFAPTHILWRRIYTPSSPSDSWHLNKVSDIPAGSYNATIFTTYKAYNYVFLQVSGKTLIFEEQNNIVWGDNPTSDHGTDIKLICFKV